MNLKLKIIEFKARRYQGSYRFVNFLPIERFELPIVSFHNQCSGVVWRRDQLVQRPPLCFTGISFDIKSIRIGWSPESTSTSN